MYNHTFAFVIGGLGAWRFRHLAHLRAELRADLPSVIVALVALAALAAVVALAVCSDPLAGSS